MEPQVNMGMNQPVQEAPKQKKSWIGVIILIVILLIAAIVIAWQYTNIPNYLGVKTTPTDTDGVACTMDAMQCPDGSYVGRVPPDCNFAQCPDPSLQIELEGKG